jgi:hypothetical protein
MDNEPSCKQYSPASLAMAGAAVANLSKEKALRKERTCCATGAKHPPVGKHPGVELPLDHPFNGVFNCPSNGSSLRLKTLTGDKPL